MEIEINVRGKPEGMQPGEDFYSGEEPEEGALVQIGFLLKDKLKVTGEGEQANEVKMKQCCYELKVISMRSKKVLDEDNLKREVQRILRNEMHMDPEAARRAVPQVTRTILQAVRPASANNIGFWTILLEVHIDCKIKRRGQRAGAPFGQHGFATLKDRISGEAECSICHDEFSSDKDIVVTTCHHVFDRPCIKEWLGGNQKTCPICRSDLAPMAGGGLPLRT